MKVDAMAKGLRVTISASEAREIATACALAGASETIVRLLNNGANAVAERQAQARAKRDEAGRAARRRDETTHHASIDGWSVQALFGDWTDISDDPDNRLWADTHHPEVAPRVQGEIRRGAWKVYATLGRASDDGFRVVGGDLTETADRAEIEPLARRLIAAA